ncbi:MAG: hypothetical protein KC501_20960 [Myxococcales bacterium]|nr:hypothetical protein [Myxococcales bacterium]
MRTWVVMTGRLASFALVLSPIACGELDIVDHDALVEVPEGNTLAAHERCGSLPEGIDPIAGLRSAWAMEVVPIKDRDATFRVATESMVLRLSDEGLECDDVLEPDLLTCPAAWATDITLRKADPAPGLYLLSDMAQGYSMANVWREGSECQGEQSQGYFREGELEILHVTDECVVGRLLGTAETLGEAGAPVEGGFVALRCDAAQ